MQFLATLLIAAAGPMSDSAPQVLCLGEALVDRLGPLGSDPALAAPRDCDDRLGGAPANVACALARLGTPVAFIGRLGADVIGNNFQEMLANRGVDLRGLQIDPQRPSRVVLVRRDATGERVFQGFAGDRGEGFADQALNQSSLDPIWCALAAESRWLLIGTIPLATEASAATLRSAVSQAERDGVRIALDVNWRPTFWDPSADPLAGPSPPALALMQPFLEKAGLIKLAREEAEWLFRSSDPAEISASLPQQPDVLVTDGGDPVRWFMAGHQGSMPVLAPPQIVDTTGAGDAFTAGLLHQLVRLTPSIGQPLQLSAAVVEQAVRYAAACGALVCSGAGAIDPQPLPSMVMEFLDQLDS